MSVEIAVYDALTGDAGVAALVSTRVYPQVLPPDVTLPAIVYRNIDSVPFGSLCQVSRVQIDVYGASYSSVKGVRDAVRACADSQSNWVFYGGPDMWQDGQEVFHQSMDVRVYE